MVGLPWLAGMRKPLPSHLFIPSQKDGERTGKAKKVRKLVGPDKDCLINEGKPNQTSQHKTPQQAKTKNKKCTSDAKAVSHHQ